MKKICTLFAVIMVVATSVFAAEETWTSATMDAAGDEVTWTADNVYILDGFVFVNDGQTLTIEAGTVVKGKPGEAELASALIIARGGKIYANGTANSPIIFTAQADDLAGGVADMARGLWGGVIVLGKGATNNSTAEKAIEGIPTSETRGLYGADPTVEDDNSGSMSYVSIRHGGTNIGEANEINGLTLGAVGSSTTFSHIEIAANADDGVEWFGGAPKCDHILVAWCGDDSYDYDEGFSGMNQFMAAIQADDEGDRLGEHDGGPSSNQLGEPYAHPIFSNVTYVGRGASEGKKVITFRDNAGGEYLNSIFAEQAKGIDIEWRDDLGGDVAGDPTGLCSYSQWADEEILKVENNIFQNVADGTAEAIFMVASEKDGDDNAIYTVSQDAIDAFAAYFSSAGNEVASVGVDAANPTASGDVWGADFVGMNAWFSRVGYKGAFKPNENWAKGWTLSLGDVDAKENTTTGDVISVSDADMLSAGTEINWTAENTYILDGFVFVNDGQTLTIEAGTVIKGKPGEAELASALIVARGGKIYANGTAAAPIIFTAEADQLDGTMAEKARGLWGGVIVLGKGATNNSTAEKAIEGIPTSEARGLYGADPTVEDDNSGSMKYVSIRHGGTNIGEANEINGLTLGAVGSSTTFSYIEIAANADDGVEWFGGTPKCDHILVAWCGDDSYDYDEGFSGMNQFMCAIQADDEGDRLGEHDGGPSSNQLGEPYAHPIFSNVTYVGRGASEGKKVITFRDNAGGEYLNSIFAEQAKGIDIEWRDDVAGDVAGDPTGLCSYSQWADQEILKVENNIFQNVADGSAEAIFMVASEKDGDDNEIYTVAQDAIDGFAAYFASAGNEVASVGVDAANPTASGDVWGADFVGMDAWFSRVAYRGAFEPNENWAKGWTLSLGDVDAKDNTTTGSTITISDADMLAAGDNVNWTSENTYILDGFVFVNDGQTLTIQAGTVIKGKPGEAELASALIVARGGKIMAEGTADAPIIFTAEADDLEGSVADKARGLWGGVIVLGKGATNNSTAEKAIEGIPTSEARGLYGADPTVEDDNSGSMSYVSIRHGGTNIGEANEINGLTLGAVGSSTTFSYIEIVANADDGVEWFGGTPKCDHILVAWCGDDSYDYDEGFSGMNQFMCAIQAEDEGDRLGEHDGGPSSNQLGEPYAHPIFSNVTYVGRGASEGKKVITFRDNAGGEYHNSIFAEQAKGIDLEWRDDLGGDVAGDPTGLCSYSQWADEEILKIENNIFQNVADGTAEAIFLVASEKDGDDNEIYTVADAAKTDFAAYFATAGNVVMDAGVLADNPTPTGDVYNTDFEGLDDWFVAVDYIGAFQPNVNWARGWTLSLGDVTAQDNEHVGIDEELSEVEAVQVNVYPNPAIDYITVAFDNPQSLAHSLVLYDMAGRSVRMFSNIYDSNFQMDRGDLNDGLYIYRLTNASGVVGEGKLILK